MSQAVGNSDITYVLFGREAVKLYKLSLKSLINSTDVECRVGAYVSVKKFVNDSKEWGDFVEISKEDFLLLRKLTSSADKTRPKKKSFLSKIFR